MFATVLPFRSRPDLALVPAGVSAPVAARSPIERGGDSESLRNRARELVARGAYREASAVYRAAADLAAAAGDKGLADEALCGWAAAETELGSAAAVMPELRRILLGSTVDHNCCLAAYTLARGHELQGQVRKALFYARLFRDRAPYVGRSGLEGLAQNLLGNLLVAEGREVEAADCYRAALRTSDAAPPTWVAAAEANLGYCFLIAAIRPEAERSGAHSGFGPDAHLTDTSHSELTPFRSTPQAPGELRRARMREGLRLIYRSIRTFRREGAVQYTTLPHLDLCLAHLELKRPASARRHGQRALELAEQHEDAATIRNSLYLLGQVALAKGNTDLAIQRFSELERRFYPEQARLANVLMSLDLRRVVNLRA